MKHTFKTLLGLVLVVFVLVGCSSPAGPEIPDGATVEFVWGTNPQVTPNYQDIDSEIYYAQCSRYLLGLKSDQNGNPCYDYPEKYEDEYRDFSSTSKEYGFKKFYEDVFGEVFGTKYYKEGKIISLKKWTIKARDLISGDTDPWYSQLYFLAEDVRKEDYETNKIYLAYLKENSFDEIEVRNENIRIYVYWNYSNEQPEI